MGNRVLLQEPNHRAAGSATHTLYDLNRLVQIDYPSKEDVFFEYGGANFSDGGAGRIIKVQDETGTVETSYGALGEVREVIRTLERHAAGQSPTVYVESSTHDSMGNLLELVYPDGERVRYEYDGGGNLYAVSGYGAGWTQEYVSELHYDVFGHRTHSLSGNGVESTWAFEPKMLRLKSATTTLPAGERIQDLRYDYDPLGNLTTMQSLLPDPGPGWKLPVGGAWSFSYDGVNRLLQASGNNALAPNKLTTFQQTFEYSPSHNLLHKKRDHALYTFGGSDIHPPHTNIDYAYEFGGRPHAPTRVGDLDLTYDPSGNVIAQQKVGTGAVSLLEWDDDGRMVQYQRMGAFQRNYYDASGRRVLKLSRLGETHYVSRTFEVRNGEMATKHIFAGGTRVASVRSHYQPAIQSNRNSGNNPGHGGTPPGQGGTPPGQQDPGAVPDPRAEPGLLEAPGTPFYFHVDHLGSTSVLTTEDGELHEHLRYFPDGEVWIEKGPRKPINGYQFSGKPYDPETGFADFGMRFYDPSMSLWLSVDPALVSGPDGAVGKPMMLSPYAYAAQSPMVFVDPDGRQPLEGETYGDWGKRLVGMFADTSEGKRGAILARISSGTGYYNDKPLNTITTAINSIPSQVNNSGTLRDRARGLAERLDSMLKIPDSVAFGLGDRLEDFADNHGAKHYGDLFTTPEGWESDPQAASVLAEQLGDMASLSDTVHFNLTGLTREGESPRTRGDGREQVRRGDQSRWAGWP